MATKGKKADEAINKIFGSAPKIETPVKKAKKSEKEEVEMPDPFEVFVALDIVGKLVEKPQKQMQKELKEVAVEKFDEILVERGGVDEATFVGVRGEAKANVTLKKTGYGVADDVLDLMAQHKVHVEFEEKTPSRYIINPAIVEDQELLGKLAEALVSIPALKGMDIVQLQTPMQRAKVTEQSFRDLAKIKDEGVRKTILRGISTTAFGAAQMKVSKALEILKKMGIFEA